MIVHKFGGTSVGDTDCFSRVADIVIENNGGLDELHAEAGRAVERFSMGNPRPSWDQYFMDIAKVVASRSNCSRRQGN